MIRRLERNRHWIEQAALTMVLPGVAGAVNASGFLALGVYTSHVTGSAARLGDELALHHYDKAGEAATLVALFLLGAMAATGLVESAHRGSRPRFVIVLLVEAMVLSLFALLSIHSERHWRFQRFELIGTLCFAMGLQNSLVTRLSGAVVRTTHLTGIVTDLGIEIVRWMYWWADRLRGRSPTQSPDGKRARVHLSIFLSFLSGATVGPALYLWVGSTAMLLPVAVLLLLAAFDALLGIGGRPQPSPGAGHPFSDLAHPPPAPHGHGHPDVPPAPPAPTRPP